LTHSIDSVNVAGGRVLLSDSVKLLGITLDSTPLTFDTHVLNVARSSYLCALKQIKPYLPRDMAISIGNDLNQMIYKS